MGRQWSAGKLVLILDAVHWNPEAPPRTLPRVRLRCGKAPPCCASSQLRRVSLKSLDSSEEPEAKRYAGAGGREKKRLRRKKFWFPMLLHAQRDAPTSGCFTPNPTSNDHSDLLWYLLVRQDPIGHEHRKVLLFANPSIPLVGMGRPTTSLSLRPGPSQWGDPAGLLPPQKNKLYVRVSLHTARIILRCPERHPFLVCWVGSRARKRAPAATAGNYDQ
ncbi:hypothetical protein LXL04_040020 [Taraxacum kok-saghyz]